MQSRTILLQLAIFFTGFSLISSDGCTPTGPVKAVIHTDFGDMIIELSDSTPEHRDNFVKLVNEGFYNDLLFHRVMKGFMIQGGDPNSRDAESGTRLGSGGPGYTLKADFRDDHLHVYGALAAARQPDNSNPDKRSSGSQFYIVQGQTYKPGELMSMENRVQAVAPDFTYSDEAKVMYSEKGGTPFLDMNYTVFGRVIEGMETIDSIAKVKVMRGNRPDEDVRFSIEILK